MNAHIRCLKRCGGARHAACFYMLQVLQRWDLGAGSFGVRGVVRLRFLRDEGSGKHLAEEMPGPVKRAGCNWLIERTDMSLYLTDSSTTHRSGPLTPLTRSLKHGTTVWNILKRPPRSPPSPLPNSTQTPACPSPRTSASIKSTSNPSLHKPHHSPPAQARSQLRTYDMTLLSARFRPFLNKISRN